MLPKQRIEVIYSRVALAFMKDLVTVLYEKDYFGFEDSALDYVFKLRKFVDNHINKITHHPAPSYFSKYKSGMKYISYQANKRTTWYIFFKQIENRFLIYYITNNHFEGQFLGDEKL
ncbi:MAG TPA: hypothetical protein PKJ74_11135 [Chitinophagales bacterium]|nr:hypothetical protein [Chitinophagales bacterium]